MHDINQLHDHHHHEHEPGFSPRRWNFGWFVQNRKILGIALVLLYLASGIYYVAADQQAVKIRFGRLIPGRVQPGLHYSWPYPVERVFRLKTNQAQRLSIGSNELHRAIGLRSTSASDYLVTGDQNLVQIQGSIQFYIQDPAQYLYRAKDLPQTLESLFFRCMSRAVAWRIVDEILTTGRITLQNEVHKALQDQVKELGLGITITTVALEQVSPPEEVRDAFLDVANSREDRNRIVQEANGYASELLPRSRGKAQEMLRQAETYRTELANRARGESERFISLWQEYRAHRDVTSARLFLEAMEEVLPRMRKVVLDHSDKTQGLDLDIFEIQKK